MRESKGVISRLFFLLFYACGVYYSMVYNISAEAFWIVVGVAAKDDCLWHASFGFLIGMTAVRLFFFDKIFLM